MVRWTQIDSVFLDMDGTLLDLHFDNHFWLQHVPQRYAETHGISLDEAKEHLYQHYKSIEGTLNWYCVDHWSQALELDIVLLKEEVDHLIAVHPHVVDFLQAMRRLQKRLVLVTNAHQKSLRLKMERTQLQGYFDAVICSHDLNMPKEERQFWTRLQQVEPFDPERTLFVDDSPAVLASARDYGIQWLLAILRPDSQSGVREVGEFPAIQDFSEITPA
ncbi:MAG: GMP/IMP nucleotidase [Chromatiales bacterium]|nr:GMP/IMP nucleotidase [Chromatiales bacterium]